MPANVGPHPDSFPNDQEIIDGWFLSRSGYALGRGYGGQIIAAHKRRNLAVAITSDPTKPARSGGYFGDLMRLLDGPVLAIG